MKNCIANLTTAFPYGRQIAIFLITLSSATFSLAEPSIATTQAGKVQGAVEGGILTFNGVRYGADTSTTRFQPSAKHGDVVVLTVNHHLNVFGHFVSGVLRRAVC